MSEFSESYHLYVNHQENGINLLKKAALKGYVFPPSNQWVTVLPEGPYSQPNEQLIQANQELLLHFIHAEDHGWACSIYEKNILVSHYECMWDDEVHINKIDLNLEKLLNIINNNQELQQPFSVEELNELLNPLDVEAVFEANIVDEFTQLIGIKNYEWVSFDYISRLQEHNSNEFDEKGIEKI